MGAAIAAIGLILGGTAAGMGANAASKKRKQLMRHEDQGIPNIDQYQDQYFNDLEEFEPRASALSRTIGEKELAGALSMRESALPGIGQATRDALASIMPLLRGELPDSVMRAFNRSGGASSVGSGFGGTGFGFLNQGMFGARGSLGAIQTGMGLLPSLLSTMPQINTPSAMPFLQQIMNPAARTNTQLAVRGQNLDLAKAVAGMDTGSDVWSKWMASTGGTLTGTGMGGMGMPVSGGGGGSGGGGSIWGTGLVN